LHNFYFAQKRECSKLACSGIALIRQRDREKLINAKKAGAFAAGNSDYRKKFCRLVGRASMVNS